MPFHGKTQQDHSVEINYFAQTMTNFLLPPAENTKKKSNFGHFNDHNSDSKHND